MAETNRLHQGVTLLEEDVLIVSCNKVILHWVAVFIDCFMHLIPPFLVKSLTFDKKHWFKLHESLNDLRINTLELESHRLPLEVLDLDQILVLVDLITYGHDVLHVLMRCHNLYPVHVVLVDERHWISLDTIHHALSGGIVVHIVARHNTWLHRTLPHSSCHLSLDFVRLVLEYHRVLPI